MCVDRKNAAPAFLALAPGDWVTDWVEPQAPDVEILALARGLDRILLTEDADFGDLIFRNRLPPPPGVLLLMTQLIPKSNRKTRLAQLASPALASAYGNFVVVGPTRCRFRPLTIQPF